jgi:hypothetical protein
MAAFTHWGAVAPWVLDAPAQFRPAAPPALTSRAYAKAINEVQSLGKADSVTRTEDQTQIARFWAAPIQNYWNEIAQTAALAHHRGLEADAWTFAALNLSLADSAIAFYDAKYAYRLWRPISAIRQADRDGNDATVADPSWTPLANTPADPSYPGAHSVISGAAHEILKAAYGEHFGFAVTSEALPGVTRSFASFAAAEHEAASSRIRAPAAIGCGGCTYPSSMRKIGPRVMFAAVAKSLLLRIASATAAWRASSCSGAGSSRENVGPVMELAPSVTT